jgi:hypothetical protein
MADKHFKEAFMELSDKRSSYVVGPFRIILGRFCHSLFRYGRAVAGLDGGNDGDDFRNPLDDGCGSGWNAIGRSPRRRSLKGSN